MSSAYKQAYKKIEQGCAREDRFLQYVSEGRLKKEQKECMKKILENMDQYLECQEDIINDLKCSCGFNDGLGNFGKGASPVNMADRVGYITRLFKDIIISDGKNPQQERQDKTVRDTRDECAPAEPFSAQAPVPMDFAQALVPMEVNDKEDLLAATDKMEEDEDKSVVFDLSGSYSELFINPQKQQQQRILLHKKKGLGSSGKTCQAITGSVIASNRAALNENKSKGRSKSRSKGKNSQNSLPSHTLSLNSLCDGGSSKGGQSYYNDIKKLRNLRISPP